MGTKKRNKPAAAAKTRKGKSSGSNSRPARRKAAAKKKKIDTAVLAVLNADKLKELYSTMMKCRILAERIRGTGSQKSQRVVTGIEATLVGAGAHLLPQDCIALEHGSFSASLIKGTPLHLIVARNQVSQTGNGAGESGPGADGAATLNMAKGLALAQEMKGKGAVMLIFCAHDAESLAFDPEAMAMAATQKLPFVSLVERSFEARLQTNIAAALGPYVGVFRVAQEAIRRAREGHGPAVIECLTSRADVQARGAADRSTARHAAQDPISFMEQYLRKRDLWSDDWSRSMVAGFTRELDAALASVYEPTHLEADFDNVYSSDGWSSRRPAGTLLQPAAVPTP
jgi:pyruvate dehydrogenase E1 component alpha subunit